MNSLITANERTHKVTIVQTEGSCNFHFGCLSSGLVLRRRASE